MDCPACRKPLVVVERDDIEVDWCLSCRGLWFDEGELEVLAEKSARRLGAGDVGRPAADGRGKRPRKCPRCSRRMDSVLVGDDAAAVMIERCPDHGIWLDRGELASIMNRLERVGDEGEKAVMEFLGETFRGQVERS